MSIIGRESMRSPLNQLCVMAGLQTLVLVSINWIWLHPGTVGANSLTPCVTGLYVLASLVWLGAIRISLRIRNSRKVLVAVILAFSLGFRAIQICAPPILELDLYRYMWDGIVTNNGVSPYKYSPKQILAKTTVVDDPALAKAMDAATRTASHNAIVSKVHFAEFTTIYPPVSQFVFAATMWLVPDTASVTTHLVAMRGALVLFDLLTLLIVFGFLRETRKHLGWAIAYAWNPLVIKEIANSGHLDSIAVFFTAAATYMLVRCHKQEGKSRFPIEALTAAFLALGTAAKLYPVILVPLHCMIIGRYGWRKAGRFLSVFVVVAALLMSWMLVENDAFRPGMKNQSQAKEGLNSFLGHWRMNDVAFSFLFENAKPNRKANSAPWYVVVPNSARLAIAKYLGRMTKDPPFFVARAITVSVFALLYCRLLLRIQANKPSSHELLRTTFIVLVAFLALQPTQNPWYWLWTLPFVPFSNNRGWLLVSGILFIYYLRFWLKFSDFEICFAGFSYSKAGIFDHGLVWIEHVLILLGLFWFRNCNLGDPQKIAR